MPTLCIQTARRDIGMSSIQTRQRIIQFKSLKQFNTKPTSDFKQNCEKLCFWNLFRFYFNMLKIKKSLHLCFFATENYLRACLQGERVTLEGTLP